MRKIFILIFSLSAGFFLAQEKFCHTTEAMEQWFTQHPEFRKQYEERRLQKLEDARIAYENGYKDLHGTAGVLASTYTIPIVFHILHQGGSENVSDAQIIDAVNILTRDYNRLNPDTANVVGAFKNNIGNPSVTFVLASKDPNGLCTNGIIRHWDSNTDWTGGGNAYKYTWPSNQYLNIYVVNSMNSNAAGYTFLPGTNIPPSMDAVVALHSYVGSIGTSSAFNSRVLTHEVGHWLDLEHVWGNTNNPGVACGDDGVFDTPETKGYLNCSLNNAIVCNPGVVENVQNYMEYSYCDVMFTNGQVARMQAALASNISGRNNLSKPQNLNATGVTNPLANCVPMIDIQAKPGNTTCTGKPVTFTSFTSNAVPSTYSWTSVNGVVIQSPTTQSTTVTFASTGTYVIGCTVSNQFGSNSSYSVIVVKDGDAEVPTGNSESFEDGGLPQYWQVNNTTTPNAKWELTSDVSSLGAQCMYIPGELLPANSIEILEGPSYDFKNNPGAIYTFKYAYAKATASNKDVFKVQASKDCGGTWEDIYVPGNTQMATGSGGVTTDLFYPFDEMWKFYVLSGHPNFKLFKNESNVRIRYYFQEDVGGTGQGNRLYLDEINFVTPTGINELTKEIGLNLQPNPASGKATLVFNLSQPARAEIEVISVTGSVITARPSVTLETGSQEIDLDLSSVSTGMYFVNLKLNGIKMTRKLVVE